MRFALSKDHLDFFYQNHFIELEDLFTEDHIEGLRQSVEEVLIARIGASRDPKKVFLHGQNAYKDHPMIKKTVFNKNLASIASELTKIRTLRLASDQILAGNLVEDPLFKTEIPLRDLSSLSPLRCGAVIHIAASKELIDPLPKKPGRVTFFSPRLPISFDYLSNTPSLLQLMIFYGSEPLTYTLTPSDPHTHDLKKQGYAFGDPIERSVCPVVIQP